MPPRCHFAGQTDGALRGCGAVDACAIEDIPQSASYSTQGNANGIIQRRDILRAQVFLGHLYFHGELVALDDWTKLHLHKRVLKPCFHHVASA